MIELSKGQEIPLATEDGAPLTSVRMGLGWEKVPNAGVLSASTRDVDLDATAVQFADGQLFDLAFYNNLQTRDGSVRHLGDNLTGKGAGDDEVITVDLSKVYGKVDTIVFLVSSYHGHTFEWIANAYCRLVDDHDVELARLTLTGGFPQTGLVLATMSRDGEQWRLRAIGDGVAIKVPTQSLDKLRPYL